MDRAASLRPAIALAVVSALADATYVFTGAAPSAGTAMLVASVPLLAVIHWLRADARRTGVVPVQDWALVLLFGWPVLIPWYLAKTRGRAGWRIGFALFAIVLAGPAAALVAAWLMFSVSLARAVYGGV